MDGSKDKGSFALGMKGSECEVGRPWQDRILHLDFIDLCIDDDDQKSRDREKPIEILTDSWTSKSREDKSTEQWI